MAENIDLLVKRLTEAAELHGGFSRLRNEIISKEFHELRGSLASMGNNMAGVLKEDLQDEEIPRVNGYKNNEYEDNVDENYKDMLNENILLQRMVNDLMELVRLQNKDYKFEKSQINIIDVVEDAVCTMRKTAAAKDIAIDIEGASEPRMFHGDYGRLRQMFINMLDNSIKYSDIGQTVVVRIGSTETLNIIIEDHGSGIEASMIQDIFDHFQKRASSLNQVNKGLGLTIAKQIAIRHEIAIQVASEPNIGTQFTITF